MVLKFGCSESWVRREARATRARQDRARDDSARVHVKRLALKDDIERIVAVQPDVTLQELKDRLATELSRQTLCR